MNDKTCELGGLPDAWAAFLRDFDWAHWVTLTFRDYEPPNSPGLAPARPPIVRPGPPVDFAHRVFASFANDLGRRVRGPVWWFRGDELGRQQGRLHLHGLVGGTGGLRVDTIKGAWRWGFSYVQRYDSKLGAAYYVTKYVTKEMSDYEISADLSRRSERPTDLFEDR